MKKRVVPSSVYTKEYYKEHAKGFRAILKKILPRLKVKKGMRILDIGCGRGDLAIYCAKQQTEVVGIDYSKAAISLAKEALKNFDPSARCRVKFFLMDATELNFPENYFDLVVAIDVFEHLYHEELEIVMKKISHSLKRGGTLLVNTEANKIYLDFTHRFYIYPVSSFLIWLNKLLTGNSYPGLPKDPRNELHKVQHVNEPTFFYLKNLFRRHKFEGRIIPIIGLLKPAISWKDVLYNLLVLLYPFSLFPPIQYLFAYDFICVMINRKK